MDANNDQEVTSLLVQALNLPRVEIDKFDGSPKHYTKFMNIFKGVRRIRHFQWS